MKLDASRQIDRFRGLEPVWQWVLGACVFLLAFLIWALLLGAHGRRDLQVP